MIGVEVSTSDLLRYTYLGVGVGVTLSGAYTTSLTLSQWRWSGRYALWNAVPLVEAQSPSSGWTIPWRVPCLSATLQQPPDDVLHRRA